MVARASGVPRDYRYQHPAGGYKDQEIKAIIEKNLPSDEDSVEARERSGGDAFARFILRVNEVKNSSEIISYVLERNELRDAKAELNRPITFDTQKNFTFGIGYAEGWRGDVVYWIMQNKFQRIFRCKVRDPSMLNWAGLRAAIIPHDLDQDYIKRHSPPAARAEIILPDFPIVNKSFNFSYSGTDL
jgi:Ni,Fe-hydrogenase III large subunit